MFDYGFEDLPLDTEVVTDTSNLWDSFGFDDTSLNVPPLDFDDYTFDSSVVEGDMPYQLPGLSAPAYGPEASDWNFTNAQPTSVDDAVGGAASTPGDSLAPITDNRGFFDGLGGQFSAFTKSLISTGQQAKAPNAPASATKATTTTAKSSLDAIGSLFRDLTTTARIAQDTAQRLTEAPKNVNKAIAGAKDMQTGSKLTRPGNAPGNYPSIPMPVLIGAAVVVGVVLLKG